jgi:hypothetical protein
MVTCHPDSRLSGRFHFVCLLAFAGFSQLTLHEVLRRERIQPIGDLATLTLLILVHVS